MVPKRWKYGSFKRFFDLTCSAVLLVVLSPVMAALSLVIRVTDGRPVLFVQLRPGLSEKPFRLIKFRTMRSPSANHLPQKESDLITPLGRAVRRLSLDELPQLWNIFRGDMSFIGPRPLLVEYLPLYNGRQAMRHQVRPGMTGLAQVKGRNALTWDQKLELDVQYVQSVSLLQDIAIAMQSIAVVFSGRGVTPHGAELMVPFTGSSSSSKTQ